MEKISANIRYLRSQEGWTQKELAARLDVKPQVIGSYEENRAIPPLPVIIKLADLFRMDISSLVRLDLSKGKSPKKESLLRGKEVLAITVDIKGKENIEFVSEKASAGYASGYSDAEYIRDLPKMHIPNLPKSATYRAFEIKGDSMLPVRSGDIIIGKYLEDLSTITNGKTYIIVTKNDGVVYKRVFHKLVKDKLLLISDNRIYQPYVIELRDVLEVWAFIGRLTLHEDEVELPPAKVMDLLTDKFFSIFSEQKIGKK